VVTRTVADTAAALDAIAVPDPLAWWNAPAPARPFLDEVGTDPGRLRVAVATTSPLGLPVDPECATAVQRTVDALADAGHEIVSHQFEAHTDAFIAGFVHVVNAGLSDFDDHVDWDRVQPNNRANRGYAEKVDSLTYAGAVAALQRWSRDVNVQWGRDFDVLVTPTMPMQPPPAGQILREITESPAETSETVLASVSFTSIFNMNGLPAISLPVHQAGDTGLPVGAQLVGGPWQEAALLRVAAQVEQLLPWADRRPVPS
jgi:amidase